MLIDFVNWKILLLIFVLFIFVFWLFFGGKQYDFDFIDINENNKMNESYRKQKYQTKNNTKSNSIRKKYNGLPIIDTKDIERKRVNKVEKEYESKGEYLTRKALEKIYERPFERFRPDFLQNPETGENLELDCYNSELQIAAEYNGIQHYHWPNFTGQSSEEFKSQLERDQYKVDMCDKHGVYLITVPHEVEYGDIEEYVRYYTPESVQRRQQEQNDNAGRYI